MTSPRPSCARLRRDPAQAPSAQGATPARVKLAQKLRVIIFCDTARVDDNDVVCLADDYYGHDARLEKALAHG
jgi:hypothetical protein